MKKTLALTFSFLFLLLALTGCYHVDSGKISDVVGIYKLVRYEYVMNSEEENVDLMERDGVMIYLEISENGKSYYYYQDNETPLSGREVKVEFLPSDDEPGLYDFVTYRFDTETDPVKLGIVARNHSLNSSIPKWKGNLFDGNLQVAYRIKTRFERIGFIEDKFSDVREKLEKAPKLAYGEGLLDGVFSFGYCGNYDYTDLSNVPENPYVYWIADLDMQTKTADLRYRVTLGDEEVRKTVPVSFAAGAASCSIDGITFDIEPYVNSNYSMVNLVEHRDGYDVYYTHYSYADYDIEQMIADAIAAAQYTVEE